MYLACSCQDTINPVLTVRTLAMLSACDVQLNGLGICVKPRTADNGQIRMTSDLLSIAEELILASSWDNRSKRMFVCELQQQVCYEFVWSALDILRTPSQRLLLIIPIVVKTPDGKISIRKNIHLIKLFKIFLETALSIILINLSSSNICIVSKLDTRLQCCMCLYHTANIIVESSCLTWSFKGKFHIDIACWHSNYVCYSLQICGVDNIQYYLLVLVVVWCVWHVWYVWHVVWVTCQEISVGEVVREWVMMCAWICFNILFFYSWWHRYLCFRND